MIKKSYIELIETLFKELNLHELESSPIPTSVDVDINSDLISERQGNPNSKLRKRAARKEMEISDIINIIADANTVTPSTRLYDMASGKSNLGLSLANFFPDNDVIAIDKNDNLLKYANNKAQDNSLSNFYTMNENLETFVLRNSDSIVTGIHPCGTATDYILNNSSIIEAKQIVVIPCCYHKINANYFSENITSDLPSLSKHEIAQLKRAATYKVAQNPNITEFGIKAVDILDTYRIKFLEDKGYQVTLFENPKLGNYNRIIDAKK